MKPWENICQKLIEGESLASIQSLLEVEFRTYGVYKDSIKQHDRSYYMIAIVDDQKKLVICSTKNVISAFIGEEYCVGNFYVKLCELNHDNCILLRELFPFTNPRSHKGNDTTIGLGDRLGLASSGHIRALKDKQVFPILAQQSIRELNLTGRTYSDVLDDVSWAVFQEGYNLGFGADGDHLKTEDEVKMALECGFTMITLDCSEHINDKVFNLSQDEVRNLYYGIDINERLFLESKYINREFNLETNGNISYTSDEFMKIVLIYLKAIKFASNIYKQLIIKHPTKIDFELSIDETSVSTTPEAHYFVANELQSQGVNIASLAPRFCGEFQKGIDYIGDIDEFRDNFGVHVKIADSLGYRISVHSGSDKFSVFPTIGEITHGRVHLKTAGTNWLEAVRVIASMDPDLYREIYLFALDNLKHAKKYYHITEDVSKIPDISTLDNSELTKLLDLNDARQVLHVTYGMILQSKNRNGSYIFRDRIYKLLNKYEDKYYQYLEKHIGKHLELLGV